MPSASASGFDSTGRKPGLGGEAPSPFRPNVRRVSLTRREDTDLPGRSSPATNTVSSGSRTRALTRPNSSWASCIRNRCGTYRDDLASVHPRDGCCRCW